jgi:hypothetical protein
MSRRLLLIYSAGLLAICGIYAINLYGAGSAYWELNDKNELRKGELENLIMTPDGNFALGKSVNKIETKEPSIWTSTKTKKGEIYVGSGSGKVYKLSNNKLEEIFATGEMLVTSLLATDDNDLLAATIPNGKIFKITTSGKITGTLFTTLTSKYVWALISHPSEKLVYAATGPDGKIYEIPGDGKSKIFYDTKKSVNILSMVFDGKDCFYFGTSNPGILYKISLKGKPEIISDFGDAEIKTLIHDGKQLYLSVNSGIRVPPQEFLSAVQAAAAQPQKSPQQPPSQQPGQKSLPQEENKNKQDGMKEKNESEESEPTPAEGQPAEIMQENVQPTSPPPEQPKAVVQSAIYKILPNGIIREIISFNNCYLTEIKLNEQGEVFAGTDNTGKLFHINSEGKLSIPFDMEANQILTFLLDKNGNADIIGTGGPGAIYIINQKDASRGSYTSEVYDAKFIAQWGNFTWKGKGKLGFQSRSGNTLKPDDTWSDWTDGKKTMPDEPIRPNSPQGRFFQFKFILDDDKSAEFKQTRLAYLINNQMPKLISLTVTEGPPAPQNPPMPGIQTPPSVPHSVSKRIAWQAVDSDGDQLGYRLYYKRDDQKAWIPINPDNLSIANEFNWNTLNLADGKYQIKVLVTDEKVNPAERVLHDEKISTLIIIDNTKPEILDIRVTKEICTGKITDDLGPIKQINYNIDGVEWKILYPKDNLLDDKTEEFEIQLAGLKKGTHTIIINAFDESGNLGIGQIEFEVK